METAKPFWWIKSAQKEAVPKLDLKEVNTDTDVDVESIIEEINRVAAQSPLGPFDRSFGERSIDDIMKEAEKVYMESSRSFEQLSQRSKTSQNISDIVSSNSKMSTPTPKSISPLPMDNSDYSSDYSEDFLEDSKQVSEKSSPNSYHSSNKPKTPPSLSAEKSKTPTPLSPEKSKTPLLLHSPKTAKTISLAKNSFKLALNPINSPKDSPYVSTNSSPVKSPDISAKLDLNATITPRNEEVEVRNKLIKNLEDENGSLRNEVQMLKIDLTNSHSLTTRLKSQLSSKTLTSPEINLELERALEQLKDSKEINTSLQLQLDTVNNSHQLLKSSYDDLFTSNKNLERKVLELDQTLAKYKSELLNVQQTKSKLLENEINLNKLLEIEKLQSKQLKLQNDKDSRCIQDLNRQIREMERIIARKHPDSVSALIVAAKENATDTNLTARKLLEDRIKSLEQELASRDSQSSKVFLEIQDKFSQMKNKYESHIEDLELHVSDLKEQLKHTVDTYDVYTQTFFDQKIPRKETFTIALQTDAVVSKPKITRKVEKEDAHLIATIRGLQADLNNKDKAIVKLQKEVDEARKTNRRLQKEREGSLRNLSRDFRSYPEKLSAHSSQDLEQMKMERDRIKQQLSRLDNDFQGLKKKRLDDLTALQEAHEREISNYMAGVTPLREQLELQQVTINTLQTQLTKAKEELAVACVERDHFSRLGGGDGQHQVDALLKKIGFLEEREYRLRAIVQSLAQKSVTNRGCEQCSERQQQLIGYKVELDQLLASVRALK